MKKGVILGIALFAVLGEVVSAQVEVDKWYRHVIAISNDDYSGNPFELELDGVFTHTSSGTTLSLPGYYDGSNTWKIGFMPNKIGEWTYVTSSTDSDLNGVTGSITCTESNLPGMLKADPDNPRKWKFTDGPYAIPIALRIEFFAEPATQTEFTAAADFLAEGNMHMMETRLLDEDGYYDPGRHDYIFKGDWRNHEFDLDVWNRMELRMEILRHRGLGAHIMFYSDDNGEPCWSAESETEKLVIRYTIARLAGYPIVWFNTGIDIGEYRDYQGWYDWFGSEIKSIDPYDHPVSSRHDLDGTVELFVMSSQLFNSRGEKIARIGEILDFYNEDNVPLSMDDAWHEESPEGAARNKDYSRHDIRRAFWKCVIAGGAGGLVRGRDGFFHLSDRYSFTDDFNEGIAVQDDLDSRHYLKFINPFIENIGDTFGSMVQASSLVSNGYALADPARTKILYFLMGENDEYDSGNGGAITIKLSGLDGDYDAVWFDPRTGTEIEADTLAGGDDHVITPPSTNDWVLYLYQDEINCTDDSDCGSDRCKIYTCNNPGTTLSYCSEISITQCIDDDYCCPSGCSVDNDNDCPLITNLNVVSGKTYEVIENLQVGDLTYIDRAYEFVSIPSYLLGSTYIRTANNDKASTENPFLTFDAEQDVTIYVAHDDRITLKPSWLDDFSNTGDNLVVRSTTMFTVYRKNFIAGTVAIGCNAGLDHNMYSIIVKQIERTCSSADLDLDGIVDIHELGQYIDKWKSGSVTINGLINGIIDWKDGC